MLQIKVMDRLIKTMKELKVNSIPTLAICGTTRGPNDEDILNGLKIKVKELFNKTKFLT